ncbi:maleylacetoacetate isomerase [Piscinibacter sakaiensis]|uniref:Maleylacetoacetate isomerase n=1 Tax=Piscinibacter sakaiensis TaxID=1547922 RepID=A0A0K8P7U8_PISS1|nr:maleylacetoacetate isomerase [Piscinibacter sakaiensis]GAP38270.1 maleylacetoacetate isomerase [Piscinibacter sakaiensis]
MELYGYFRSSASYRVRIALALKGLPVTHHAVHLVRGEQEAAAYRALNPSGLVPLLVDGDERIGQSLAILEYLDEVHPVPPLLPADPGGRARVRSLALDIACEIHPLNNLRVLRHLTQGLGLDEAAKLAWYRHWVALGLAAVEARLAGDARTGRCCHGDQPTLADAVLVPQVFNAERFDCPLDAMPTVRRIAAHCRALPAFEAAHPSNCPDAA